MPVALNQVGRVVFTGIFKVIKNQEFMEIGFTYFTSEDRSQGMTLSIEDGFRPLIGDLGSTVLLGYMVRGF